MTGPSAPDTPFDPGLQLERTALAWRRTTLAIVVCTLVCLRIVVGLDMWWVNVSLSLTLVAAVWVTGVAHLRYRRHHRSLNEHGDRTSTGGGLLPIGVAALTTVAGLAGILVVIALN